jgi:hypothetical protein
MLYYDPLSFYQDSQKVAVAGALRVLLMRIVESKGIPWLATSPPAQICSLLGRYSNSTVTVSGSLGGVDCLRPVARTVFVSLEIMTPPRNVTLEAWT